MEPTPGPRACLEELGVEWARDAHAALYTSEVDYVEFVLETSGGVETGLIVFVGMDCLEVVALRVRGCGEASRQVLGMTDWPEVARVDLEGDCAQAVVPGVHPYMVRAALERLGAWPPRVRDARVLDHYDVEELTEVPG